MVYTHFGLCIHREHGREKERLGGGEIIAVSLTSSPAAFMFMTYFPYCNKANLLWQIIRGFCALRTVLLNLSYSRIVSRAAQMSLT